MLDGGMVQRLHLLAHILLGKVHVLSGKDVRGAVKSHLGGWRGLAVLQMIISLLKGRICIYIIFVFIIFLNLKTF